MPSLITTNFSTLMSQQFVNLLDVNSNSYLPLDRKSYNFVMLGKQTPWNAGVEVAPTPGQSTRDYNGYFDRAILAKRVSPEDVSFVVPRYNWTSGTVYSQYGCTLCPIGTSFYVLNSKDQVFKCLDNNNLSTSTDEPQLILSSTSLEEPYFITADGYKWKYLYTLNSSQKQKFLTQEWMPVTYNRFVRAAAVNRSIDIVRITNSGNNYVDGATQDIITVVGDGTSAALRANVVGGQITDIIIQNRGQDYTKADLIFNDVAGGVGTDAAASVVLSPQNGHGYDPVEELYSNTLLFNVDYEGTMSGVYPTENEFREISIVHNPYLADTSTLATGQTYPLYTTVSVSPGVGDFNNDEVVIQGDILDNATFSAEVISFDELTNTLYLNNLNGTFQNNLPIKGLSSGSIRVGISSTSPSMQKYTGKILYASTKLPVNRDSDQTDRIRFILSF
jgi:hypothetical protein